MSTTKKILVTFAVTLVAGGIVYGGWLYKQYLKLYNATWAFGSVIIHKLSLKEVKVTVFFKVNNTGYLSASITEQNYEVLVNGTKVATVKSTPKNISGSEKYDFIGAKGISEIPFLIEFTWSDLIKAGVKNADKILTDQKNVLISVNGYLSIKSGLLSIDKIPFDLQYPLSELTKNKNAA